MPKKVTKKGTEINVQHDFGGALMGCGATVTSALGILLICSEREGADEIYEVRFMIYDLRERGVG